MKKIKMEKNFFIITALLLKQFKAKWIKIENGLIKGNVVILDKGRRKISVF